MHNLEGGGLNGVVVLILEQAPEYGTVIPS
jgi:hypothetical protein